jgi:hypothetical protein
LTGTASGLSSQLVNQADSLGSNIQTSGEQALNALNSAAQIAENSLLQNIALLNLNQSPPPTQQTSSSTTPILIIGAIVLVLFLL